jgi:glycosyltransferase
MKISIITICLNKKNEIKETIESVLSQTYSNIEYILIDGGSTDGSLEIINSYSKGIDHVISEPDNGIYSAINKGLRLSNGEVIGLLHAGDLFYDDNVLFNVQNSFKGHDSDLIYGHSAVFKKTRDKLVRKNISPPFKENLMKRGWFPSHQSIYFKASVFDKCGYYNEGYKIAGDYEFLLRALYVFKLRATMVDVFVVKFHLGGASSNNLISLFESNYECYKAWKLNNLSLPFYTLPLKVYRKIWHYLTLKFELE